MILIPCLWASSILADPPPGQIGLFADRQPLFSGASAGAQAQRASLFVNTNQGGFFAPLPQRLDRPIFGAQRGGAVAARLRDLIARAEAGKAGYDAVQYGARIKPRKPPTDMTLAEIYQWIDDTPGQPHAIGRYQFIPSTLRRLVNRADLPLSTRFSPATQDQLGDLLLSDAGLHKVKTGEITRDAFKLNLAKIWAGFPTKSGRSYYHGFAGNKSTMTYEAYSSQINAILGG